LITKDTSSKAKNASLVDVFMRFVKFTFLLFNRSTRIVKGLMGVLHNILHRVNESWQPIREENAVTVIQRFRLSDEQIVACKALILQVGKYHTRTTGNRYELIIYYTYTKGVK
jgi:hypothetical protein